MQKVSNFSHNVKSFSVIFTKPTYQVFKAVVTSIIKNYDESQSSMASFTGKTLNQIQYFFAQAKWSFSKLNAFRLRFMRNKTDFRNRQSDFVVLDGSTTKKDRDSEFKGLLSHVYSNRDKQVVNGIKIMGASVLTKSGVKYILDFILFLKSMWLSENQAWIHFAKRVSQKTSAYLYILDSGFRSAYIVRFIFTELKRHFLIRLLPSQCVLIPTKKKKQNSSQKKKQFENFETKKIQSLLISEKAINVEKGKIWIFENVIVNSWKKLFPQKITLVVYHANGHLKPIVLATSEALEDKKEVFRIVEIYFKRWSIEQLFKEVKHWFRFEKFKVTSLHAIGKFLHLIIFVHSLISVFFHSISKNKKLIEIIRFVLKKSRNIKEMTVISLKLFLQSVELICLKPPPWLKKQQKTLLTSNFF
jgi:hypothetical protein